MAFSPPELVDFFARYPEFRDFDENWVQVVLDEAISLVGEGWIERYRRPAILALTAHLLLTQQVSAPVTSDVSGGTTTGPIQSETVGPLTIQYKRAAGNAGGGSVQNQVLATLDSTAYGVMYQQYMSLAIPAAIMII